MPQHTSARDQGTGSDSIDLTTITSRQPLVGGIEAFSGARSELVESSTGRRAVVKHLPSPGDWQTRATDASCVAVVVIDVAGWPRPAAQDGPRAGAGAGWRRGLLRIT